MKNLLFILLLSFNTISLQAKEFDGEVIMSNGDTISCKILLSGLFNNFRSDELLSRNNLRILVNDEKRTITSKDMINFSIYYNDEWQTYWSIKTNDSEYQLMRKVVNGDLILFYCKTYNNLTNRYTPHYYFKKTKKRESMYMTSSYRNKKYLINLFDDCDYIVSQLKKKKIKPNKYENMVLIAEMYNDNCASIEK